MDGQSGFREWQGEAADSRLTLRPTAIIFLNAARAGFSIPAASGIFCGAAAVLSDGDAVRIEAGASGAGVLLLAGKSIGEPIVQYGSFVMNTRDEIEQAVVDYQSGKFATA
jgi:redox-sensitive bicupin YhaK (pirin superfamily)